MTNNISTLLKKYSVPALFLIIGLVVFIIGITNNQNGMFMIASILLFLSGGLSVVFSSGKLKSKMLYVFGTLCGIAGITTISISYISVNDTLTYEKNYKTCKELAKQNLQDIRYVQKEYNTKTGKYLSDWESFEDFIKNGTIPFVESQGVVPNRRINSEENKYLYTGNPPIDNNMTENEAYRLSKWIEGPNYNSDFYNFKRDTIQVSLMDYKFGGKSYKESRIKAGFHSFHPDSLKYIPFTAMTKEWNLETVDSIKIGDNYFPAIKVSGEIPFANVKGKNGNREEMYFGSLTTNDTEGSWEVE